MANPDKLLRRARNAEQAGEAPLALRLYRQLVAAAPQHAEGLYRLGTLLAMKGELDDAVAQLAAAAHVSPRSAPIRANLGLVLKMLERDDEAEQAFRDALAIEPGLPQAANNLASLLVRRGRPVEAEALARRAVEHGPDAADYAAVQLANALADQARVGDAIDTLRALLARSPAHATGWHNLLSLLHYDPHCSREQLHDAHRRWGSRHPRVPMSTPAAAPPAEAPAASRATGGPRLRVGYLSCDLREHPVGWMAEPVLAAHDRDRIECFVYHDSTWSDALTERLRALPGLHWREAGRQSNASLGDTLRADRLDLLVETSGHLAGNRLELLATRPAPRQVTWLGYPGSTGLAAIDAALSDHALDPAGEGGAWYAERVLRLPRPSFCFAPPAGAPEPQALPAGALRLGSFNNLRKLNDAVIAVWSRLLARLPDAVLVMQARGLAEPALREALAQRFASHGVAPARLEFHGSQPLAEHLRLVSSTHFTLDPWPWNGHMTSLHALWMGVPVLSLAGDRRATRMGRAVLDALGLGDEWVADSAEAYVERGVARAHDRARLAALRTELRSRLQASALMDGAGLARALEDAFERLCAGN